MKSRVRSRLAVALLVFILPRVAPAEVKIAKDCRVKNRPPGRCGWCAIETLARHHQIKPLYGLVDNHPTQSRPRDLEKVLDDAKVCYRSQSRGCFNQDILRDAIRHDLGAVVGLREMQPGKGGHIVTLIDFGDEAVRIIDPNDPEMRVQTLSRDAFLHRWDGFTLILMKPSDASAEQPMAGP